MDMPYKPSELAEEIDTTSDTIKRSYVPAGLPVTKDDTGHVWINGLAFVKWAKKINLETRRNKRKEKLPDDKAYCVSCRAVVKFKPKTTRQIARHLDLLQAQCPKCGKKVNKIKGIERT